MAFWDGTAWMPEPAPNVARTGRRLPRLMGATLEASLVVMLSFGLIAGTAFAAKGGNAGGKGGGSNGPDGGSSFVVVMVADANNDGAPNTGESLTFEVSTDATDKPWVLLNCYQGGHWVSTATHGFFAAYPWPPDFTLASGAWTSGAGNCTATLYMVMSNGKAKTLAMLSFDVAA